MVDSGESGDGVRLRYQSRTRQEGLFVVVDGVAVAPMLLGNPRGGQRQVGVVVDGVRDVVEVNFAARKIAPDLGSRLATEYLRGLTCVSDGMLVLLDIDRMIGAQLGNAADA